MFVFSTTGDRDLAMPSQCVCCGGVVEGELPIAAGRAGFVLRFPSCAPCTRHPRYVGLAPLIALAFALGAAVAVWLLVPRYAPSLPDPLPLILAILTGASVGHRMLGNARWFLSLPGKTARCARAVSPVRVERKKDDFTFRFASKAFGQRFAELNARPQA